MTNAQNCLTRRYLLWCYKTTKERLDWIDRKFTQLAVDQVILKELEKKRKTVKKSSQADYINNIEEFKTYMQKKKEKGHKEKFLDPDKKCLQPEYIYLSKRLEAIESAIVNLLGNKELKAIRELYEQEMTRRILESRDNH